MMKRLLPSANNRGASSVLIILMMVVLIVFGLAALTTSLAASRLGDKSSDWTGEYYQLEGDANVFLFEVDVILLDAELAAIEYIEEELYTLKDGTVFPDSIQHSIYNNFTHIIPESSSEEYLSRVFEAAFCKYAIEALIDAYPGARFIYNGGYLRQILEDEGFTDIRFGKTISEKNSDFAKNLDILIKLIPPSYNISIENRLVSGTRARTSEGRYEVLGWKEWQEYFDYSDQVEFEDLFDDAP